MAQGRVRQGEARLTRMDCAEASAQGLRPKGSKMRSPPQRSKRSSSSVVKRWYFVTIVVATIKKAELRSANPLVEVDYQHHLVRGTGLVQAIARAKELGREAEGDDRGSLLLFKAPAVRKFIGVARATELLDEVYDGCEIGWDAQRRRLKGLREGVLTSMRQLEASNPSGWPPGSVTVRKSRD